MMGGQQRAETGLAFKSEPGLFKSYNRGGSSLTQPSATSSSYYHGLNYGTPAFNDNFPSMTIPTSLSHDYSPMPAHMPTQHGLHPSHPSLDMSRGLNPGDLSHHQSSATASVNHLNQTVTSPQATSTMGLTSSPPMPSTSRLESISPEQDRSNSGHISSSSPGETSMSKDFSDNSSEKSGDKDDDIQGVPLKKRALSLNELQPKDDGYWDKRKKNNESAKRSREARRMKEEQIALRVVYLEQENLQLRTEVSLLKSEIEKLRCMLYNS